MSQVTILRSKDTLRGDDTTAINICNYYYTKCIYGGGKNTQKKIPVCNIVRECVHAINIAPFKMIVTERDWQMNSKVSQSLFQVPRNQTVSDDRWYVLRHSLWSHRGVIPQPWRSETSGVLKYTSGHYPNVCTHSRPITISKLCLVQRSNHIRVAPPCFKQPLPPFFSCRLCPTQILWIETVRQCVTFL